MVMDMRHKCNYKFCKNKAVPWLNVPDEPHTITAALTAAVHAAIFEVHAMPAAGAGTNPAAPAAEAVAAFILA